MNGKAWACSLALYNRLANKTLYASCEALDSAGYRAGRPGSFGSIHNLLNHLLLGDRIWMARFTGSPDGAITPPLNTILFHEFLPLRQAREAEDARIESFFASVDDDFFTRTLHYRNSRGIDSSTPVRVSVPHFFNHQTHHRAQVHVMLAHAGLQPPGLDLHRFLAP